MELNMESLRKRKGESIDEVPKKRKLESSEGEKDGTNQSLIKASKRPGGLIQDCIENKRKRGEAMGDKADDGSSVSPKADTEMNMESLRKRKRESIDEVPKRRRTETSEDEKDVPDKSIIKASKRPGSPIQESIVRKRKRGEAMGDKADDGSSMSPRADTEQLSGTTPAESPIIVTGLESFTFHKIIGQGGYGKVMLATHKACKQKVAVKMVNKRLLIEDSRDDILIERQVLEMTRKSPFITRAFSTFQSQDYVFYVMEYLSGGDLRHFLIRNAPLPIPAIRDLKPENILLDSTGHLKIADFGLAATNIFGDTKTSDCVGTYIYRAPEVRNYLHVPELSLCTRLDISMSSAGWTMFLLSFSCLHRFF
ncbi:uncharacterized protein LOC142285965 [Anomaloglossus baeobatrachus]|uniref:uncharacterized protein LOC142285965 n=1 Tax=Anomaloglossus baeobatrachus TaxID=238106 RepID=UPI003F509F63